MRILSVGESEPSGSARYLLGVLHSLKARVTHVPPSKQLSGRSISSSLDAVIFSDCARRQVPAAAQRRIARQVEQGMGFLMIGGWASFTGLIGGWRGSIIESLLPVCCLAKDDRRQFPNGALMIENEKHAMFHGLSFAHPPSVGGLNEVKLKPRARVILSARPVESVQSSNKAPAVWLSRRTFPLLIICPQTGRRVAALTADVAPHWSGGLVDWGKKRVQMAAAPGVSIEVGERYAQWLSQLIRWVAKR